MILLVNQIIQNSKPAILLFRGATSSLVPDKHGNLKSGWFFVFN